ncbi:BlaI/MecI/CopY family transcriptional regulator [Rubritalea marina]|uniref:BlaI/MecI/CopY family transcriptional regulator n=1 Tax=Rubritalea marina TaxID=361055 RepID=UPI0003738C09|nr:BlaI/MecI/CopY family transcriptional regulator [Rubritalea marina]
MRKKPTPTDSELDVLNLLWQQAEQTVKEVHENLAAAKGYTTTLKIMQIMQEKQLIERVCEKRPHRYRALVSQKKTQTSLLSQWMDKLTSGSAAEFAMKAIDSKPISNDEVAQLRDLLDQIEEKNGKK